MQYTTDQLRAMNTLDKNLQIIACAGSGKTQVISQRVVNILKQGTAPSQIIAFTYTEKAAAELQARILKLCRDHLPDLTGIAEMYIGTIHSWCLNVLQEYKYEFQKFSVLDEIKLKLFVDRKFKYIGMEDLNMERFKDTGRFTMLMGIVREAEVIEGESLPDDIIAALEKYESILIQNCFLDFTMIMTKVIEYLDEDENFRKKIEESIGYLIVDEYQDVNPIQEGIVRRLYDLGANVCVVGDDDQTIFQWRGSDVNYIQGFRDRYQDVEYIRLQDNFRSSKAVVDVALNCITNNEIRLEKSMNARGFHEYDRGDILYNQFSSVEEENEFIAKTIRNLRGVAFQDKPAGETRGLDYSDVVILLRKWKKAGPITEALQAANIPFIVTGVNNLFNRPEVIASRAIFQFLKSEIDRGVLKDYWLEVSEDLEEATLDQTIEWLEQQIPDKTTYYEKFNLQSIFMEFLERIGISEELFHDESGCSGSGYHTEEIIFYNLGMFSQIIQDFETINFRTSAPDYKLFSFLGFLRYSAEDYYPEGWLNNTYKTPNAVQIMTVYQSKGLEFPVVFIPGLNRNYLPSSKPTGKRANFMKYIQTLPIRDVGRYLSTWEDERRLMYVAITRAKKFLIVTRSPDGRMQGKESVFGEEIRNSDYIFSSHERDYAERERTEPRPDIETSTISLNFSLLKAFFDCPYSFKFWTFYGFQSPIGARMGYGSAIHNSLMELHREALDGNIIAREELAALMDKHVNFPYATKKITESMTQKANEAMEIYHTKNLSGFKHIEFAEKQIQIDLGDGIIVNGKMDLIKKKKLDGQEEKIIIDFKSTEDAQAYNATIDQLQLYALGYRELTGENADFLEIYNLDKNDSNRNELVLRDLDGMRKKIVAAANDIRNNVLDHTCNDPKCVCRYKQKR